MAYDEVTRAITVSETVKLIKATLDESFYQIMVLGEISGYRPSSSGHAYFDLKDNESSLPSAVFRSHRYGMYNFQNGDMVVATGRISIYEKTGKLTFVIHRMVKAGDGLIAAEIEKRKEFYRGLGWFDQEKKKPLPEEIRKVGVVTSAAGAVFHDILDVTRRRAPSLDILLFPCAVQGDGAEETIASRIRQANNFSDVDVLIVGRGGGSQEDLAPFSSDAVIQAIHDSVIPVVSAVGHETDWALSDYVADVRAGTPSIAAEMVTASIFRRRGSYTEMLSAMNMIMRNRILEARSAIPGLDVLHAMLEKKFHASSALVPPVSLLSSLLERKLADATYRSAMAEDALGRIMDGKIREKRERLSLFMTSLPSALPMRVKESAMNVRSEKREQRNLILSSFNLKKARAREAEREMEALSPLSVLSRGYAVVTDSDGSVIFGPDEVPVGDGISIRLARGTMKAKRTKE